MRLDRNTLLLIIGGVVVIVAALLLGNPASAPEEEATDEAADVGAGPLFEGEIAVTDVIRFSVTENESGDLAVIVQDEGSAWDIEEATNSTDRAVEQTAAATAVENFLALESTQSFEADDLADFGLAEPVYTLVAETADATYTIYVGNEAPTNPRYYVQLDEDNNLVRLVQKTALDTLIDLIAEPPYVPPPTPTPTPSATPNPLSEVDMTATAEVEQTATAEFAATATAEAEAEPAAAEENDEDEGPPQDASPTPSTPSTDEDSSTGDEE